MSSIEQWLNTYGSDTETELDTTFNELTSVEKWMMQQEQDLLEKQKEEERLKEELRLKELEERVKELDEDLTQAEETIVLLHKNLSSLMDAYREGSFFIRGQR